MKWIGALLLISASTLLGYSFSSQMRSRTNQLRILIQSIHMIEAEMVYGQYSLQQIFFNIGQKTNEPFRGFYKKLASLLTMNVADFFALWDREVNELQLHSTLKKNEIDILKELGKNIGNHPIDQQIKHITLTNFYLKQQLEDALQQEKQYQTTMKSLGVLIGILIVLILI